MKDLKLRESALKLALKYYKNKKITSQTYKDVLIIAEQFYEFLNKKEN